MNLYIVFRLPLVYFTLFSSQLGTHHCIALLTAGFIIVQSIKMSHYYIFRWILGFLCPGNKVNTLIGEQNYH